MWFCPGTKRCTCWGRSHGIYTYTYTFSRLLVCSRCDFTTTAALHYQGNAASQQRPPENLATISERNCYSKPMTSGTGGLRTTSLWLPGRISVENRCFVALAASGHFRYDMPKEFRLTIHNFRLWWPPSNFSMNSSITFYWKTNTPGRACLAPAGGFSAAHCRLEPWRGPG